MSAGLLDPSVVIDWDDPVSAALPDEAATSAVILAERTVGPHLASTGAEAARRQSRLQQLGATFEPIPFGLGATRSYGQLVPAVVGTARSCRRWTADLVVPAIARANGLAVCTRNLDDVMGLGSLIEVIGL